MATSGRGQATNLSVLQLILGGAAYTAPDECWAALFSNLGATPPNDQSVTNSGVELATGTSPGYARAEVSDTNAAAAWSATTADTTGQWKTNADQIAFDVATAQWQPAVGYGLFDAETAGILLYWGTFDSATTVGGGATASFGVGALRVTEA
jgi:hypothetical protein